MAFHDPTTSLRPSASTLGRAGLHIALLGLIALITACSGGSANSMGYDPDADPFEQLESATARAKAEHKLILVVAGGDWCHWCHVLHDFIEENSALRVHLDDTFVEMKVYTGEENSNDEFFDTLPEMRGVPHWFVLSADGKLLASQNTGDFSREDDDETYNVVLIESFIQNWKRRQQDG
jgi:hypothetical protein